MNTNQFPQYVLDHIEAVVKSAVRAVAKEFNQQGQSTVVIHKDEDFLSAEQAADFMKIKINTVYAKVEKGELPHYRSGKRKLLFSKKELTDYISIRKGKCNKEIRDDADDYILGK